MDLCCDIFRRFLHASSCPSLTIGHIFVSAQIKFHQFFICIDF